MSRFRWISIIIAFLSFAGCDPSESKQQPVIPGGESLEALNQRILLNQHYYFCNTRPEDRGSIYTDLELGKLSRGKDSMGFSLKEAEALFEITHTDVTTTRALISIRSNNPQRINWHNTWAGTAEEWHLVDGEWKLADSRTRFLHESEFINNYFGE